MILFYYGRDGYQIQEKTDDMIRRYEQKYGSSFNLLQTRGLSAENAADALEQALKSISFFEETRFVVMEDIFSSAGLAEKTAKLLEEHDVISRKDTVVLVAQVGVAADLKKKHKELFALLSRKNVTIQEFKPREGSTLTDWMGRYCAAQGKELTRQAAEKLAIATSGDSWRLVQEMDKLCNHPTKRIDNNLVDLLVYSAPEFIIFPFLDALAQGNQKQAVLFLDDALLSGLDPYYLLVRCIGQFRTMMMVADLVSRSEDRSMIAQKTGIHPFVVSKTLQHIRNQSTQSLTQKYKELMNIDTQTKNGQGELPILLTNFIVMAH